MLLAASGLTDALQHRPWVAVPTLFGAGLVTSLTPCIYPMIPITAGLLGGAAAGEGGRGARRPPGMRTLGYGAGRGLF